MQAAPVELVRRPAQHVPAGGQCQQGADRGLVRHRDDRLAVSVRARSSAPRRAIAVRGDSPPGGWKSSPAASAAAKVSPPVARSSASVQPSQTPKLISRKRGVDGDGRRGLHELGRAPRALQRTADPLPAVGRRRQAPAARRRLAFGAEAGVGRALQAALGIPDGRRVTQDGERARRSSQARACSVASAAPAHAPPRARRDGRPRVRQRRRPDARARPGASSRRATAAAKAAASPIGVSRPVTPSATTAGTPPVRPATTGRPAAWASRKAMP